MPDEECPDKDVQSILGGGVCLLVAQSFILNVPNADFAIQNSGGCRTNLQEGDITFGDAVELLPFSNTLVTLDMSGEDIRLVLEDAFNFTTRSIGT